MPDIYSWPNYIDASNLPADKQAQTIQCLNWLETYFPEFKEMLYDIGQCQKRQEYKKISLRADNDNRGSNEVSVLNLTFKPTAYIGTDLKVHAASLNEILVHELGHFALMNYTGFKPHQKMVSAAAEEFKHQDMAWLDYLKSKGIDDQSTIRAYARYELAGDKSAILDESILNDPRYIERAKAVLVALKKNGELDNIEEATVMNYDNILRQLLGKPPRGSHTDGLDPDELTRLNIPFIVYTQSPDIIRKQAVQSWPAPPIMGILPQVSGQPHTFNNRSLADIQREWTNEYNAETKNISADEWRVIEEVKENLLKGDVKAITAQQVKEIEALADKMKTDFNQTSDNDPLSTETISNLSQHGLSAVADKARQLGWRLK